MKTQQLSPSVCEGVYQPLDRSERAAITGEICERLIEWAELRTRKEVHSWLCRLATLGGDKDSADALWLYLRLSTGDMAQLTASFTELGGNRHRSKQAEQQEMERALAVIQRHFPELATALQDLTQHFATLASPQTTVSKFQITKQVAY